jgi:hypothetical protein
MATTKDNILEQIGLVADYVQIALKATREEHPNMFTVRVNLNRVLLRLDMLRDYTQEYLDQDTMDKPGEAVVPDLPEANLT